jgi:hypothetical protein
MSKKNAKQRIACGNGVSHCGGKKVADIDVKNGTWCKRHASYAGLTFDFHDFAGFEMWLNEHWFIGASWDRIEGSMGYVCRPDDIVNDKRFGNIQLTTVHDNVVRAHKGKKKRSKEASKRFYDSVRRSWDNATV